MKAQYCPLCGSGTKKQEGPLSLFEGETTYRCRLMNCVFSMQWYPLGVWNRIRIALNGEKLDMGPGAGFYSWMDPKYPEGE